MVSDAQKKAVAKYDKENSLRFNIKLNKKKDADIIQRLEEVENRNGYIKSLIRKDMEA